MDVLDVLQKCIDELDSTTKEEFEDKKKELEIQNKHTIKTNISTKM